MEVTKSILFDLREISETLELACGEYLLPDVEGWYLPYAMVPAIRLGERGCVMYHNDQAIPFTAPEAMVADVVNKHGHVVVPFAQAKKLTMTPRYSPRSLKLIRACVEHLLNNHAIYLTSANRSLLDDRQDAETRAIKLASAESLFTDRCADLNQAATDRRIDLATYDREMAHAHATLETDRRAFGKLVTDEAAYATSAHDLTCVIRQFVFPQYAGESDILNRVEDHVLGLRNDVVEFLGEDRWIMHFQKMKHGDLEIEKTIDYRILQWHQMTGTPL